MKELFGIPTVSIMIGLVALLGVALVTVLYIGLTNRTIFRMGVRNLPRRGLQTGLVVVGLMLATLITTAAFSTGDTVDHSLTKDVYKLYGRSDIDVTWNGERDFRRDAGATNQGQPVPGWRRPLVAGLEAEFANDSESRPSCHLSITNLPSPTRAPAPLSPRSSSPASIRSGSTASVASNWSAGGAAHVSDPAPGEVY
jgi:hypothetical protein